MNSKCYLQNGINFVSGLNAFKGKGTEFWCIYGGFNRTDAPEMLPVNWPWQNIYWPQASVMQCLFTNILCTTPWYWSGKGFSNLFSASGSCKIYTWQILCLLMAWLHRKAGHLQPQYRINSLWSSDTKWGHRSGSTLSQVMACCLMAPSYYLSQCWRKIIKILWHLGQYLLEYSRYRPPKLYIKFTHLKSRPHLQGVNELIIFFSFFPGHAADNPCWLYPCLNGGSCTRAGDTGYTCECPFLYTGQNCDVDLSKYKLLPL